MEWRLWREFNIYLLLCVLALLSISIVSVYSATLNAITGYGTPMNILFPRHIVNIAMGLVCMIAAMSIDYRLLSSFARPIYITTVVILAVVLIIGKISEGARSWIEVGTRTFQPAEAAKLLTIIVLAAYWSHFEDRWDQWSIQLGGLVLAGVPLVLVLVQPDLGTAVVFGFIWLIMAWTAGIRWQQLLILGILAVPLLWAGWEYFLDDYQHVRLLTFYWLIYDPTKVDPDHGYNIIQSLTAIGSGGMFGTGLTRGLLSQGNYIPVQYSDFIFSVIAEEMGFVGGIVILLFQGLLLWFTLSIAGRARDSFGRLLAVGIFATLLCHMLINIGVAMSIMPVTGLPLPLISYGGSFTIITLTGIGLLESIAMRWRRIAF